MKWFVPIGGVCGLFLMAQGVGAQTVLPVGGPGVRCCPPIVVPEWRPPSCLPPGYPQPGGTPANPSDPSGKPPDQTPGNTPPTPENAAAQSPTGGTEPAGSFNPGMFSDLIPSGRRGNAAVPLPPTPTTSTSAVARAPLGGNRLPLIAPFPDRAGMKISENESPLPIDRVFLTYNYYNNVDKLDVGSERADLHREMFGFEKTFWNGDASFGMRFPFLQLTGDPELRDAEFTDLSMVFKYAFINDRQTGNVLSGGMVLTAPTGREVQIFGESPIHSTVFQPFLGFVYNVGDGFYVEGFSSVAVPTDARDITIFFNSLAVGYHLYKNPDADGLLREIVPVAELHVNTPLNHRGWDSQPLGFPDAVDTTVGVHFVFRRATAGIAFSTPLTGPKPYEYEAMANVNFRF